MTINFPLGPGAFADRLPIMSVRWWLKDQQELSGLGSGQLLAADLGPRLWRGEVVLDKMDSRDALDIQATIEALDGALNPFYLYDPRAAYPRQDPDGSLLGGSTPAILSLGVDNKSLSVSGLPSGYVLSRGDFFHFNYGSNPVRRALHRVAETAVASGAGNTTTFEVRPHFRPGVETDIAIQLIKPSAKVLMVPDSFDPGTASGSMTSGMAFHVQQTL